MANLETLTLEINGNAASAAQGINTLIGSLSALGTAIDEQAGKLRIFSNVLKDIHSSAATGGGIRGALSPFASHSATTGIKNATKAAKEYSSTLHNAETIAKYGNLPVLMNNGKTMNATDWMKSTSQTKTAATAMSDYAKTIDTTVKATAKATKGTNELARASKEVAKTTPSIRQANHATTGLWKTIGRIAKTMMIRTAIRALMKLAKQGVQNFYQYAKSINSSYATAIDKLGVGATKAGNQLGAAIGTLLATVAPILSAIISLVTAAVSALTAFFSLLGGGTTFTAATDGMNSFAKAAGGGGSAMKELLADFDEFNVIAQEGGGGGGGGGGGAFSFAEMPIPRWMEEWKPLLEALFWGTIGATILPAIASLLGNIVSLFTGTGAGNLLTILKYLFTDKIPKFPDVPDSYTKFPTQPDYKPFPAQPEYKPFPIEPTYTPLPIAPDYAKAAVEMGALSAAANSALPAVEGIAAALTAIGGANLLMNAITTLLTKLAGATMKIKVDRKEFDKFKKEVDAWAKGGLEKSLKIKVDNTEFRTNNKMINDWLKAVALKVVNINVRTDSFEAAKKELATWTAGIPTKMINMSVKTDAFDAARKNLATWVAGVSTKFTNMSVNTTAFETVKSNLATWLAGIPTKMINMSVNTNTFDTVRKDLATWLAGIPTKMINISVNTQSYKKVVDDVTNWVSSIAYKIVSIYMDGSVYNQGLYNVMGWVNQQTVKVIKVAFDSTLLGFLEMASALNAWASETLTKVVNIVVKQVNAKDIAATTATGLTGGLGLGAAAKGNTSNSALYDITHFNILGEQGELNNLGQILKFFGVDVDGHANGAYGIPNGDLFIANEVGAELVGSMNGRTTVANQSQIIEGIQRGVSEANESQNALLRQQNDLLRGILEKEMNVNLGASASFGRTVRQSLDMYNGMTGSR